MVTKVILIGLLFHRRKSNVFQILVVAVARLSMTSSFEGLVLTATHSAWFAAVVITTPREELTKNANADPAAKLTCCPVRPPAKPLK